MVAADCSDTYAGCVIFFWNFLHWTHKFLSAVSSRLFSAVLPTQTSTAIGDIRNRSYSHLHYGKRPEQSRVGNVKKPEICKDYGCGI